MYRSLPLPLAPLLFFQAAAFEWFVCDAAPWTASPTYETASLLARPSEEPSSLPPNRYYESAMRLSSVIAASSTPNNVHHHVAVIAGVCLGAAAALLLLGLVFFWVLLRHRQHMAIAQVQQDVVPRSWVSSECPAGQDVAVVANHPSLSVDLAGADVVSTSAAVPASDETAEVKRWHPSTDVLDISVENVPRSRSRSPLPLPEPIEPYVPRTTPILTPATPPQRTPALCIRTDVHAESPSSLPDSHSHESTPAGSSRSPIRPLPTPPTTGPRMRRPRSAKAEEARRESRRSNLPRFRVSADDLRPYVHGNQRSTHMSYEADRYEIVQHHDGGMNPRIDLPPPYHECMQVEATPPST
ncbi:hypothetical protein BJV74DRAFT_116833 [Russula compacta]|nr:hypothetical protein BJV74DRAFT_116833 [Russula compacta]